MKKIYIIGIGGIGISGIARYYNQNGYKVFGSDKTDSELIKQLQNEGIDIIIGENPKRIDNSFEKIIYTEAILKNQSELKKSIDIGLKTLTYPEGLAEIANKKKLIGISGTHGKSTTTSMISLILKNSNISVNALVGSLLKEFDGKNVYFSNSEYFVLEACEYKRSFLKYKPFIGIITNIDLDHLDYYKDLSDYISAFKSYAENIIDFGYLILNGNCANSMKLFGCRKNVNYVIINDKELIIYNINFKKEILDFPKFTLKIPGKHIEFDAKIAYALGRIIGIKSDEIISTLENYNGIWRRSEIVGITKNKNILISDYGHHPTEISLNLEALKTKYFNKKILTVFQPHQYNRTLKFLENFKNCFGSTDILIVPNIYESRDNIEDKTNIDGEKFVQYINHSNKIFGNGLKNTLNIINEFDKKYSGDLLIILQGAGDIDDLRFLIELI